MGTALEKEVFDGREKKSCLIVGDLILDRYITGEVNRISPEAPIPVVRMEGEKATLGGAANVAGNLKGFHKDVFLCGLIGKDENGERLLKLLEKQDIHFVGASSASRCTTTKLRVVGMNQQLVRIDREDRAFVSAEEEEGLLKGVEKCLPNVQLVVLSDYDKGVCSDSLCRRLMDMCRAWGKRVIVDPKSRDWSKYMGAYLITPNFKEFCETSHSGIPNAEAEICHAAEPLMERYQMERILVTRSQYGMTLVQKGKAALTFPAIQQEVFDVSGAGDTVVASIAALLADGQSLPRAVEFANYAAGLAVSKAGTYMVTLEEVLNFMNRGEQWYADKIIAKEALPELLDHWRRAGEKIVFTNGCFDILHIGHVDYLNKARRLGGRMIVGLNSDASVRRLKGSARPVNGQLARAGILAAMQCVDAVVIFAEDTPEELIRIVKPDILVKGADYRLEDVVGREYAGEVRLLPLVEGCSTTQLIQKLENRLKESK